MLHGLPDGDQRRDLQKTGKPSIPQMEQAAEQVQVRLAPDEDDVICLGPVISSILARFESTNTQTLDAGVLGS